MRGAVMPPESCANPGAAWLRADGGPEQENRFVSFSQAATQATRDLQRSLQATRQSHSRPRLVYKQT